MVADPAKASAHCGLRSSSGSLAMLAAMRSASSVMRLAAARRPEHVAFAIDVGERLAALTVQSQAKSGVIGFSPSGTRQPCP